MSVFAQTILLSAVFGSVLVLCQLLEQMVAKIRDRRAAMKLKERMDAYHEECRRTGHYDF